MSRKGFVDKNLFDDNEDTGVTMCFWRYGQGIDNPHIVRD